MSLAEILDEIPKRTFAERQELVRRAIAVDDEEVTAEENALLDAWMEDFRRQPEAGTLTEESRHRVCQRLPRR